MLSAFALWVKWNHPIKFKNYCISFRVSCLETTAGRQIFVINCCCLFPTPLIYPADLWLAAITIFLACPSSLYSQPHSSFPLLPLFSLLVWLALLTLPFSFSAGLSLLPRTLTPADSWTFHLSFPELFSTKTSHCPLTEPVPPHRLGTCHPPRVTAGKLSTHEVCLHQHLLVPTRMLS